MFLKIIIWLNGDICLKDIIMQKFKLVRDFREWEVGEVFKKVGDLWSYGTEFINKKSHTLDTLLEISKEGDAVYLVEVTRFTPVMGEMFYYITGAGEIKEKEWTGTDWCKSCRDTFGVFQDVQSAMVVLGKLKAVIED